MPDKNQLVVVDTNCLVRLYFSPVRPLLSKPVALHELKTLEEMARELRGLASGERHAWLNTPIILDEVNGAVVQLTRAQRRAIEKDTPAVRKAGQNKLHAHCSKHNTVVQRNLSYVDAFALTASIELKATLATDEWPLRLVAASTDANDNGDPVQLLSSIELLSFVEREGLCTREERIKTYLEWAVYDELTPDSPRSYKRLFGEGPPKRQ